MCLIPFTFMGSKLEMMDKYFYQNFDNNEGLQSGQIATIAVHSVHWLIRQGEWGSSAHGVILRLETYMAGESASTSARTSVLWLFAHF